MQKQSLLARLEFLGLMALHAYPALYCRSPLLKPGTPAAFIADAYRKEVAANLAAMPAWQRLGFIYSWPPAMVAMGLAQTLANGRAAARRFRRGMTQQFRDQMQLAFRDGVPVSYYYLFELHDQRNRERAPEYLFRAALKKKDAGIYKQLYALNPERRRKAKLLNNKLACGRWLAEHGLPTVPLLAVAEKGVLSFTKPEDASLPSADLFLKPSKENGGTGAELWRFAGGRYRGPKGLSLQPERLAARIAAMSRGQTILVQPCLRNHPGIADLSAGALSTLRMYTCWNEQGEAEHIFTMLRMSRHPHTPVDNICRGGLAAAVDAKTGILGQATGSSAPARAGWVDRHPVTGAPIAGRLVPFWSDALALVLTAHRKLAAPYFIGWDIAITESGLVIVEANKAPDIEIEQRLSGPWGNDRFGQMLVYHLKREAALGDRGTPNTARQRVSEANDRRQQEIAVK